MNDFKNLLSYSTLLEERKNFRNHSRYDEPGLFYFKVLFYFENPDSINGFTSNLLGLGSDMGSIYNGYFKPQTHTKSINQGLQEGSEPAAVSSNTAYNYLLLNGERERAGYLKDFIYLLSEISSETPWYFKSIEGLDSAVERTFYKEFKFEDDPKSFTITCLNESVDNRISTLLELYRAACYSQRWKREIVPSNLRKFDMGIYIFQSPINGVTYSNIDKSMQGYISPESITNKFTNCKYIEFHNCEIDQNSIKSCYSTIDNSTGIEIEPKITIMYDDCVVSSYNETLCKSIGDIINLDLYARDDNEYELTGKQKIIRDNFYSLPNSNFKIDKEVLQPKNIYGKTPRVGGLARMLIDNTLGKAEELIKKTVRKAYLGNVYGLSVRNIVGNIQQIASGDLIGGVINTVKTAEKAGSSIVKGNVGHDLVPSIIDKKQPTTPGQVKNLGNINKQTLKNNI